MKKRILILALFLSVIFLIPLLAIPTVTGASQIGWYDVQPLGSGTSSYQGVVGGSSGDYVYAVQTGSNTHCLLIFSIADPSNPVLVSYVGRPASETSHDIDVNDDETIAVIGTTQGIFVFNITDKVNPNRTAYFKWGANSGYDVEIVGNLVYCAAGSTGLPVVDITDIYNPTLQHAGSYTDSGSLWCHDIAYDATNNVVYGGLSTGYFKVFTLDGSGNPTSHATIRPTSDRIDAVTVLKDNKVAVLDDYGNLAIVDVSTLSAPTTSGTVDIGGASGYYGGIAYNTSMGNKLLAVEDSSMVAVSFSNPSSPSKGETSTGYTGYEVAVAGDYAFVAGGPWGLFVYSLSAAIGGAGFEIPGFSFLYILSTVMTLGLLIVFMRKERVY